MTDSPPDKPKRQVAAALHYQQGASGLPTVVASGYGTIADQILELAFSRGIKVREDADLAEILAAVDIGSDIPLEAFHAVCELLAYVYKANGQLGQTGGQTP